MDSPDNQELLRTLLNEQLGKELDLLSQRVKAEQETTNELKRKNDLEEQSIRNLERNRQAENQKIQFWLNISEQTANIVQELPNVKLIMLGLAEKLEQLESQSLKDISERLDRVERGLLLLLDNRGNTRQAKELISEIEQETSKRRILTKKYRALQVLEEQLATYGIDRPAHLVLQVEDLREEIEKLQGNE